MMTLSDADMLAFDWVPLDAPNRLRLQGRWLDTVVCTLLVRLPGPAIAVSADSLGLDEPGSGQTLEISALWSDGTVVGAEQAIVAVAVNYARQQHVASVVATLADLGGKGADGAGHAAGNRASAPRAANRGAGIASDAQTYAELGFFPMPPLSGQPPRVRLDLR